MTRMHHLQIQECTNCGANYRIALPRCPRCKTTAGAEEPVPTKEKPTRAARMTPAAKQSAKVVRTLDTAQQRTNDGKPLFVSTLKRSTTDDNT